MDRLIKPDSRSQRPGPLTKGAGLLGRPGGNPDRECRWCQQKFDPRPVLNRRGRWRLYCSKDCRTAAADAREQLRRSAGLAPRRPDTKHKRRERNRQIANEAKAQGCTECGRHPDPVALDFHHRDRRTKLATVASLVNRGVSEKRLRAEIEKCAVLCASCHRELHHGDLVRPK